MSELCGNKTDFSGINGTDNNCSKRCSLEQDQQHITVLPWIYLTLAVVGFLVNGLAMLDLWRSEKTPTVIFTLNIVVSDLMVCCSFPFRTAYYSSGSEWKAGSSICLITGFVMVCFFSINLYCNMCFLLWTSINRYATVVQPRWALFQAFRQPKLCWVICAITWILGTTSVIGPLGYKASLNPTGPELITCFYQMVNKGMEQGDTLQAIGVGIFFFILGLMLVSYSLLIFHLQKVRGGSMVGAGFGPGGGLKVRRKILATVVLFVACFLPYHVQRIRIMAASDSRDCQQKRKDLDVKTLTIVVAALSCCLHPMMHLVLRLPCCRVKRNVRPNPKPEITRSQITPNIQATELTPNVKKE
ncbi:probable G-protein coupled receptor 82 [Pygocentrus nattereri]|uniref:Si:dkey-216e24.9 n=1 Tax=Pygocentrus nattereri TaxID=42514 RepID=A0AAR2JAB5_PYGNA|nr:probable G-protein coupled receptor 82 [Pygocentrus nattereri]